MTTITQDFVEEFDIALAHAQARGAKVVRLARTPTFVGATLERNGVRWSIAYQPEPAQREER